MVWPFWWTDFEAKIRGNRLIDHDKSTGKNLPQQNQIMDLFPLEPITGDKIQNRFEPEEVETSKQPRALLETPPPPPQWVLDLHSPPKPKTKATIPDPPGYSASSSGKARASLTLHPPTIPKKVLLNPLIIILPHSAPQLRKRNF